MTDPMPRITISQIQQATAESRTCSAPDCGKPLVQRSNEYPAQYRRRTTCGPLCRSAKANAAQKPATEIELHQCRAPGCTNIVQRKPGEKPGAYKDRQSCSFACSQMLRALASARTWVEKRGGAGKDRKRNKVLNGATLTAAITEAEAIAAFIKQRGVTHCPPKFAAVTLNAALPESEARQVIKRMRLPIEDASWKGGSKRSWIKAVMSVRAQQQGPF